LAPATPKTQTCSALYCDPRYQAPEMPTRLEVAHSATGSPLQTPPWWQVHLTSATDTNTDAGTPANKCRQQCRDDGHLAYRAFQFPLVIPLLSVCHCCIHPAQLNCHCSSSSISRRTKNYYPYDPSWQLKDPGPWVLPSFRQRLTHS